MNWQWLLFTLSRGISPSAKWSGVDQTVVERFAAESGRAPWKPLINTDTGDLLLFVFLGAGIVGGFLLGYYYRKVFSENPGTEE
jgi:cobalt/nickel transport system permease protein